MNELKVKMKFEKETKNKIRYSEDGDWTVQLIGTLYIPKKSLGNEIPREIEVIVRGGNDELETS